MAISIIKYTDLLNWSMGNVLGETLPYSSQYDLAILSDLLKYEEEKCVLEDQQYYQQVTLRSNGYGLEKRRNGYKKGIEILTKDQHQLRTGQLVFSKIDARNGAFALVSEEYDGAIVTKDFPTYRISEQRIRPAFLLLLLLSEPFQQIVSHCSKGTTKRQRVDVEMLMNQQVPVPTLAEQDTILNNYHSILGDLDKRAGKILLKEKAKEQFLVDSLGLKIDSSSLSDKPDKLQFVKFESLSNWNVSNALKKDRVESLKYTTVTLDELGEDIILKRKGFNPKYEENSTVRVLNQKCVRWNFIDKRYAKGVNELWARGVNKDYTTREGDILVNSTGEGTIGRSAVVEQTCVGMLYDSHIILLRVNHHRLNPYYLSFLINSEYGQSQIAHLKSAKTTHQTELGVFNLSKIAIPVPPISEQEIIVAEIQIINSEISVLSEIDTVRSNARNYFEHQVYEK